jgi:hypothetical protein
MEIAGQVFSHMTVCAFSLLFGRGNSGVDLARDAKVSRFSRALIEPPADEPSVLSDLRVPTSSTPYGLQLSPLAHPRYCWFLGNVRWDEYV